MNPLNGLPRKGYNSWLMLGILLPLLASLSWGIAALFSRKGLLYFHPRAGAFIANGSGFILATVAGLLLKRDAMLSLSLPAIISFAVIGIISIGLANLFYYQGISRIGAARAFPITAAAPLFAVTLAAIFLGESLTLPLAAGAFAIVCGLYLISGTPPPGEKVRKWGYIFPLMAAAMWGISALLIRRTVTHLAPALAGVPVSLFMGALIMLPLGSTWRRPDTSAKADQWRFLFLMVAGSFSAFGSLLYYSAMAYAPVAVVTPLGNTGPLITILGSHLFMSRLERITPRLVGGALLVVGGAAFIAIGRAPA